MNQQERWAHIVNGGKLRLKNNHTAIIGFKDGKLYNFTNHEEEKITYSLQFDHEWEIYNEPKWYEKIPKIGTLCVLKTCGVIVMASNFDGRYIIDDKCNAYVKENLTPLTNEEIKQFLTTEE